MEPPAGIAPAYDPRASTGPEYHQCQREGAGGSGWVGKRIRLGVSDVGSSKERGCMM